MPLRVHTTIEIGLREQRDILVLTFRDEMAQIKSIENAPVDGSWEELPERKEIIRWLDNHAIGWEPCFHMTPGYLFAQYEGTIYIDVAPQAKNPLYQQLLEYLEDESEQCRFPGVGFWLMPYEMTLKLDAKYKR
ncbi:hypothetical protein [Vreelandella sulfidaeris]